MIKNINSGYFALVVVGVIFFALQFWWLSMTIRNGRNQRDELKIYETDDIRKRLEKIFSRTD